MGQGATETETEAEAETETEKAGTGTRAAAGQPALPRLRPELQLLPEEGGLRVADPVLGRELRFAGRDAAMLEQLRQGSAGEPLESGFVLALDRLHLLAGSGPALAVVAEMRRLLGAPLPDRPVRSQPLSPAQAQSATLIFHPGVRYACVGCGVCCHSFLLGPLRPADVERLEALRWPPGVRLPVGQQAIHHLEDEGEAVPFLRTHKGRCVFLGDEGLCEIHRRVGGEVKPLVCRLFPYTFTRLGPRASAGIAVSLQFESLALGANHGSGPRLSESEAALRKLLVELGSVPALPDSVPLGEGLRVPLRSALQCDAAALEALEGCPDGTPVSALARRVLAPLRSLLAERTGPRRGGKAAATAEPSPPLPQLDRWLEAQLAWQQEIESGLVPLLPETLDAQRDLLLALERRRAGGRPASLAAAEAASYCRSWLRAALHGRDAYRAGDLVSGWVRNVLRLAVTALLAGSAPDGALPPGVPAAAVAPGLAWAPAAVRASKLFQVGHSPDRPAMAVLANLPLPQRLDAIVGWLEELEGEAAT